MKDGDVDRLEEDKCVAVDINFYIECGIINQMTG